VPVTTVPQRGDLEKLAHATEDSTGRDHHDPIAARTYIIERVFSFVNKEPGLRLG
jgi:hypothetical protein